MQVTETLNEGLKRQFTVVVPADAIAEKTESRLKDIAKTLKLPGFRPGKVPFAMIKKRYGDSVMGEVLEKTVQDSSGRLFSERGLRVAGQPDVKIVRFEKGSDLEYSLSFEVLPEIEAVDFSALKLERLKAEASNDEVERGLERLSKSFAESKPVESARPAVSGDTVVIDFIGAIDGEGFEGGSAENHPLELGSGSFIPGFEEGLIGVVAGDQRDVAVVFPSDYSARHLAGKEAVFKVTVKELREVEPAAIDDELAKKMGVEGVEALKSAVRERLEQSYAGLSRLKLKRALLDELAKAHDFPIPQTLAEREFQAIWSKLEQEKQEGRLNAEQAALSEDALKQEYRAIADRRVRLGLLLTEVGRKADLRISEDEIRNAIIEQARRYPGQEQQVIKYFLNTPTAVESLQAPIYEDKVVDHILEKANVTEKIVTPQELLSQTEADAA